MRERGMGELLYRIWSSSWKETMIDLFTAKPSPSCPLTSHNLGLVIAEIGIALPSTTSFVVGGVKIIGWLHLPQVK